MSPCSSDCTFTPYGVFGVQSLRVLGAYDVLDAPAPMAASSVHLVGRVNEFYEAISVAMSSCCHGKDDSFEELEGVALLGQYGSAFEERDSAFDEVSSPAQHQHHRRSDSRDR